MTFLDIYPNLDRWSAAKVGKAKKNRGGRLAISGANVGGALNLWRDIPVMIFHPCFHHQFLRLHARGPWSLKVAAPRP
jgi:hypothetical protein